jgi:hypothetical protein
MFGGLLPLSHEVPIAVLRTPHVLWRIPAGGRGCPGCGASAAPGALQFAGRDWHPECFLCSLCRRPFADRCVPEGDLVLHPECYRECFGERCARCAGPIAPGERAPARGLPFHQRCFRCAKCGDPGVTSCGRLLLLYGFPHCPGCFEAAVRFFPRCLTCRRPILPSEPARHAFFFRGRRYAVHGGPCARCAFCQGAVPPGPAYAPGGQLVCQRCYAAGIRRVCAGCNGAIFETPVVIDKVAWHPDCCACVVCRELLTVPKAVFVAGVLKCRACAQAERNRCGACGRPVEHGIQVGRRIWYWHADCLRCQFCRRNVTQISFVSIRDRPCCERCRAQLILQDRLDRQGTFKATKV